MEPRKNRGRRRSSRSQSAALIRAATRPSRRISAVPRNMCDKVAMNASPTSTTASWTSAPRSPDGITEPTSRLTATAGATARIPAPSPATARRAKSPATRPPATAARSFVPVGRSFGNVRYSSQASSRSSPAVPAPARVDCPEAGSRIRYRPPAPGSRARGRPSSRRNASIAPLSPSHHRSSAHSRTRRARTPDARTMSSRDSSRPWSAAGTWMEMPSCRPIACNAAVSAWSPAARGCGRARDSSARLRLAAVSSRRR